MDVEVSRKVIVPDDAVNFVGRALAKAFPQIMYDNCSRDQREHENYSMRVAAKAIAEYEEWARSNL